MIQELQINLARLNGTYKISYKTLDKEGKEKRIPTAGRVYLYRLYQHTFPL